MEMDGANGKFHKSESYSPLMNIRVLQDTTEYEAFENVMREVWDCGERDIVPHHLLRAVNHQGGLILGAFDDAKMVGVLMGFLAYHNGILHHHSHLTGVLEQYKGVGYLLKQKQREFVISQGLDLITWTFDPLQSSNAYFNFAKLGVISTTYLRDYYGKMRDRLNAGISSDRLLVEWWLRSNDVVSRANGVFQHPVLEKISSQADLVNPTKMKNGMRENTSIDVECDNKNILIEIPTSINAMKEKNMKLAQKWRKEVRVLFETYFSKGYTAYNVISDINEGERRTFYLLRKDMHENSQC
jgi:predicted GNAT superfamily acetyltransferase